MMNTRSLLSLIAFVSFFNAIAQDSQGVDAPVDPGKVVYEPGVVYKPNGKYFEDSIVNIESVVQKAAGADYVLLCIGENSYTETPGNTNDLTLSLKTSCSSLKR